MAGKTKHLSVFLKLNSKAFTSALKRTEKRLNRFSKQLTNIGSSLTMSLTAPLLAVGGSAVKLASEFESSMTKIHTLVGLPKDAVDQLGDAVLRLSGKTATAPKELADGLYFLTSAGLDANSAMRALESVSKASAAGLGEMTDLAKVAAAAQNAYGEDVMSASGAMDIFGKMVQTGMFNSEELAAVLGKQLGLASNLGVSFEEVGAMISTYTRTTGDATSATNGLSAVMMTFAKLESEPTKQQAEALKAIGMSADDVKKMLGEQGLMKTLQHLQTQFGDNDVAMASFFSKSQALKGVLGVLGNQTENYTDILGEMDEAQGFVNNAFDEFSQTSEGKFKQAMSNMQAAGVSLGESLMPVATKLADALSKMASAFSRQSEETREKIVKIGIALAALGPSLFIIGKMVKMFALVVKAIRIARGAVIAFGAAARAMNPVGLILAAIVGFVLLVIKNFDKSKGAIAAVINYFIDLYNESMAFKVAVEGIKFGFKALWNYIQFWWKSVKAIFTGLGNAIVDIINFRSPKESLKKIADDIKDAKDTFTEETSADFDEMMGNIQSKQKIEYVTEDDVGAWGDRQKEKINELGAHLKDTFGSALGLTGDDGNIDIGEVDATLNLKPPEGGGGDGGGGEGGDSKSPLTEYFQGISDKWAETVEGMEQKLDSFVSDFGTGFADMVATTAIEGGNLAEAFGGFVKDMIKQIGQLIVKMLVMKALMAIINPAGGALGGGGGIFGSLFGFANGGIVTGPTLGLVGEGSNISMSNPEVIAPLSDLRSMIGGGGSAQVHGKIQGSNILISNDRSTSSRYRVSGSVTEF